MSENASGGSSVGQLTLELVISAQLQKQLEKISRAVEGHAEKIGEKIENAVARPVEEAGEKAEKAVSSSMEQAAHTVESRLTQASENAGKAVERNIGGAFDSAQKEAQQLTADIDSALARMNEVRAAQATEAIPRAAEQPRRVSAGGYAQYDSSAIKIEIDEASARTAEERVGNLTAGMRESIGRFEIPSELTERLNRELAEMRDKMELLQRKWQELQAEKARYTAQDVGSADWNSTYNAINTVERQMLALQASTERTEQRLARMAETPAVSIRKRFGKAVSSVSNKFTTLKKKIRASFSAIKSAGAKATDSLRAKFTGLGKSITKLSSPVTKFARSLKSAFKRIFIMATIYAAFRAVKDVISKVTAENEKFSASLNETKANISILLTSVTQAAMPALNNFMEGLASATRYIAVFVTSLLGTTYKQAAETVKKLNSVTDSAKKAKMSAAGIDEMNILSSDSSTDEEKEGIDYDALNMKDVELPDWAERLKTAIKNGDWTGVGSILAERVNAVFDSFDPAAAQEKINSSIRKITDGLNGFIHTLDWDTLGDAIAGGINTAFSAVHTFFSATDWKGLGKGITASLNRVIKKTDWKNTGKALASACGAWIDTFYEVVTGTDWKTFGKGIGETLNAWVEGIDFSKLAELISGGIAGLFDVIIGFIQTVDWMQIGQKISEFIANIDWNGIVSRAFELLGSVIAGLVSLLWGSIRNAVASIKEYFSEKIEECGGSIAEGLWKGIKEAFKNVGKWIYDNILKPFVDGFKKAFDIHSPSKVMAELGGYIIDGLLGAIADGITFVREKFEEMLGKIKGVFEGIKEWFGEKFQSAYDAINGVFLGIGDWFSERWDDICEVFSGIGEWFSEKFQSAYDSVTEIFSGLKEFFRQLWSDISDGAKEGINWVIDRINGLVSAVESAVNFIIDGINSAMSIDIPDNVPVIGGTSFSLDLPTVDIPEIPKLAKGGLATAPTLAMVGDNRNARTDPEVIAPLSKLEGMIGDNTEITELLRKIVELLSNGFSIEVLNYLFSGSDVFRREVVKAIAKEKAATGGGF